MEKSISCWNPSASENINWVSESNKNSPSARLRWAGTGIMDTWSVAGREQEKEGKTQGSKLGVSKRIS
ncbi:hypothetical protein V8V91_04735 [Algoriphagus halophilus]|uniref:hypothetical protein n=1 Tax=Algoriphagus halophilus TaxID=226505 RepID=UPI00358E675D